MLVGDGVVLAPERAARLTPFVSLVRGGEGGALLPACDVEHGPLVQRLRCARTALTTAHVHPRALPGALGIAAVLLAAGLFFEVHEVLEREWRTLAGARRRCHQGLIQIAVGLHHLAHRNPKSAVRLFATAREKLAPLGPSYAQVDIAGLLAGCEGWERVASEGLEWPDTLPLPVLRAAT